MKTTTAKTWTDLRPGDGIRIGYQGDARNGTFLGLAPSDYDAPLVRYVNEHGRPDAFVPHVNERPRAAR